ncbi:MAG: hypothetical protein JRJ02_10320, partial [Deltaproteobacteria bacterium]|nr:hypothetical protein [Deltaproteobacteria bacterium]
SVMRKLFRRPISQGGRDHLSHRMVAIGFSEKKAVLVLYAFSVASGLIALAINYLSIGPTLVFIVLYLLFIIFFWIYLARVKVYQEDSIFSNNGLGAFTPILVQFTYKRRLFEVLLDFILVTMAYYTAYLLRFEGPVYYLIGGNFDLFAVMAMLILLFIYRFHSFSRAVFIIYWILMLILVSLSRLSFRLVDEGIKKGKQKGKSALIYGAGSGGQMVVKEIENNRALGFVLVGFIDDNPRKYKRKIMGYPVLGGRMDLEKIIKANNIKEIIISFKQNSEEKRREVRSFCHSIGVEVEVTQMSLVLS